MPIYDIKCGECGHIVLDVYQSIAVAQDPCVECGGGPVVRVWIPGEKANAVIQDSIPGGLRISHGLCHADGTPRRFDSKSEIAREAAKRGYMNDNTHIPAKGSDKSKHTSRWT